MSIDVKVTLLYPPVQSWPGTMCKPNGSLAYPNLGGALLAHDIEVEVYDAAVGNHDDDLDATFYQQSPLPSGLLRTGVSDERILQAVADAHMVGITSIFTDQDFFPLSASVSYLSPATCSTVIPEVAGRASPGILLVRLDSLSMLSPAGETTNETGRGTMAVRLPSTR